MKFFKSLLGYFISGVIINGLWNIFINNSGILGAYLAGLILTGTMWFLNHYEGGLIENEEDVVFIDMAFAVAICGLTKDWIIHGVSSIVSSMPTLGYVTIGAVLGGIMSGVLEKGIVKWEMKSKDFEISNTQQDYRLGLKG